MGVYTPHCSGIGTCEWGLIHRIVVELVHVNGGLYTAL